MNSIEAKKILLAYRPGSTDARDPEVADALAQAQRDPALQQWLEKQVAFQQTMQETFQQVPAPSYLRDRILSRAKIVKPLHWSWGQVALAAAAALVLLLGLAGWWLRSLPDDTFQTFRSRMVRMVLRQYAMDIVTNDMTQIRHFLATNNAPSDYVLTQGLAQLPATGAGVLSWQGQRVSMVCLDSRGQGTLFLFIVDRSAVKQPPAAIPEFAEVSKLTTVSWTQGGKTYLLAGHGGKKELQRHL